MSEATREDVVREIGNRLKRYRSALHEISQRDPCDNLNGVDGSCMFTPTCIGCLARAALGELA